MLAANPPRSFYSARHPTFFSFPFWDSFYGCFLHCCWGVLLAWCLNGWNIFDGSLHQSSIFFMLCCFWRKFNFAASFIFPLPLPHLTSISSWVCCCCSRGGQRVTGSHPSLCNFDGLSLLISQVAQLMHFLPRECILAKYRTNFKIAGLEQKALNLHTLCLEAAVQTIMPLPLICHCGFQIP